MTHLDKEEIDWITELAYEGRTVASIARETGRSEKAIRRALSGSGLLSKGSGRG